MKQSNNSISLERSPQYVEARKRYIELQLELTGLDSQLNAAYGGLGTLTEPRDLIRDEASTLLSGTKPEPVSNRAALINTIEDLTHRIAVLRQAVSMQGCIVGDLRVRVGHEIATELLPQHKANVAAVVEAAIALSTALHAEALLRDELTEQGVPFTGVLRAMPIHGFNLRDDQSKLSRYLLECAEYGFVTPGELPDIVRERLPRKTKPQPKQAMPAANSDGWLAA